ncbi:MAG: ATP-binding protein [Dysgonamonadaceae bacterium]|nr:ATP-binding protein [Dysgonamonadaceae bacterium]
MQIKIQNFGPVRNGLIDSDGYIQINDLTVFIGNQGTGKSTVAKLISTFCWLEKALFRGYVKASSLSVSTFKNKYCKYQKIDDYFTSNSYIHFIGHVYEFEYRDDKFTINHLQNENYLVPQIMYVPAERNFLSAVDRYQVLKSLPAPLYTFSEEFEKAEIAYKDGVALPLKEAKFEYNVQHKLAYISGKDYKIRLSEASSGIQSLVPLFIVSQNLAQSISKENVSSKNEISLTERKMLETEVEKILLDKNLSEDVKMASLQLVSSKFKKECFFNIVEEIEQNLYPQSQKNILFYLIELLNRTKGNRLLLNTHSPYIISYLTLAIKAKDIVDKIPDQSTELSRIVPLASCIDADRVCIYEIDDNGTIRILPACNGIPSDENLLNTLLADTNFLYGQLQEIEEDNEV